MIKIPKNESLNIVPFIDVMLVLLAIVLSISTFIAQGKIKIDLPQSANSESQNDEKKVKILVDKENKIYLDDKEISIISLRDSINQIDRKMLIELRSDKEAKFQTFIQIIDILKEKGHENFSIATEK
ncbi:MULTISPECIES: TonB system transport protein ExbD [Helicobacter]|uniref:Biopolymer transport protein ExbD n=1 Tax=Helicobacter ibis TaxID=2962633 RepID=A0ABT4VBM7_9HELI|nr:MULTISPECIES: TonB system transport protein ExbD [Helicobacter]MDA3966880.1 TonB system transport protein ExbD [Helicobacter sp. WB40]MDA3968107.1 TonB system transport protein ExbD [Helicobacter ibis]